MSERNDAYNKAKELLESLRKDFHVLFSELSEKDKLIELTNNNLLAALEELKLAKQEAEKWKQDAIEMAKEWQTFKRENNINP